MGSAAGDLSWLPLVGQPKRDPADTYRIDHQVVDIVRLKVGTLGDGEHAIHLPRVEELCQTGETRLIGGFVGEVL